MSLRETNKLISEALNNMNVNLIKTDKQVLSDKLDYIIETLNNKSLNNYNIYSKAFQECIEDVYPDKDWYEVVNIDIEEDLFNTSDPYKTKEHILDCIKEKEMTIEDAIKEDYDVRQYTNRLLDLVKDGLVDKDSLIFNLLHYLSEDDVKEFVIDYNYFNEDDLLQEDTVKKANGKWTNRGDDGEEHGEFKTKKEADAQRKAMYANGYKESFSGNRRLDILLDTIDDSFPEIDSDMFRENLITEAIRLTSIPGVKRDPSNDFSDDGNRFTTYIYKDTVPISYLKADGNIYLTIAFHHLHDINSEEYRKFDSYKVANDFNGVSESSYNADVFAKNLELAYNDIVNFRNNIEDVDEDEIDRRIEEINKSCEEYKEKVKNYLNSRIDKIMNLTPSQFRELQGYVRDAGTRTADYIKDLNQASKRQILSQDINALKKNIAHLWNFKYIEELIG